MFNSLSVFFYNTWSCLICIQSQKCSRCQTLRNTVSHKPKYCRIVVTNLQDVSEELEHSRVQEGATLVTIGVDHAVEPVHHSLHGRGGVGHYICRKALQRVPLKVGPALAVSLCCIVDVVVIGVLYILNNQNALKSVSHNVNKESKTLSYLAYTGCKL